MDCQRCGSGVSLWSRDLISGLCPKCREDDRKAAQARTEQEAESARQAAAVAIDAERERIDAERKRTGQDKRDEFREKCPACGSARFRAGVLGGSNFAPKENWIVNYFIEALACLTCGHVRLFLFEGDRAHLDSESPPSEQKEG